MKPKIFYILIFLFGVISVPFISYGNTNTREYCEEQLRLAEIERQNENYVKSIGMLLEIKPIVENNNWPDLQIRTLHNIGLMYAMIFNYDKSLEYFIESYELAIKNSDKLQEIRILNNIANVYHAINEIGKAKEYIEKAYQGVVQMRDTMRIGKFAANIGFIANEMGDLDLAEKYIDIAIATSDYRLQDTVSLINTYLEKGRNLYFRKRYSEAEKLLLESLEKYSSKKYDNYTTYFLLTLSKIYQETGDIHKSIYYLKEGLNKNPNLSMKISLYEELSNSYRISNSPSLVLLYQDSLIIAKDSLVKINNMAQVANNQIRFDLLNSEKELAENKAKQKSERILFIWIIVFIVILALILIWLFHIRSAKNKQQKVIAENNQEIAENKQKIVELELEKEKNGKLLLEQQLKEQETLALLEQEQLNNEKNEKLLLEQQLKEQQALSLLKQEQLNNEIELKNRQLATKVLLQSNRNEFIEGIINTLSDISDQVINSSLASVIKQLERQVKESSEWDSFLVHFEQINPTFLSVLKEKHSYLTANDIRLLTYIYLGLNTKEIALLLNITFDSCKKKKQRLANKMEVETSTLYNYLINME